MGSVLQRPGPRQTQRVVHKHTFLAGSFSCVGLKSLQVGETLPFIEPDHRARFSQPEVVVVVVEVVEVEEAMNMARLHLRQTLALSMRTKLKVNYMLSTAVPFGAPVLVIFMA